MIISRQRKKSMTVLSTPMYATPHLLNYDLLEVSGSLPKQFLTSHIQGLPVAFGLSGIDDVVFYKAQLGNSSFRIPAYVIHFEHDELSNIIKAQYSAFNTLGTQIEQKNLDVNAVLGDFVKFIDEAMLCDEARKLKRNRIGEIGTTPSVDLALRHGTCLVEGSINFPDAEENGNHQFKISYFDLTQDEYADEDPNYSYDKSNAKGLFFTFTDIRGWKPSQECQSAEWAYGFRLPDDLNAHTDLNAFQALMREMIDFLSVQWNEEFGEDVGDSDFAKIIFDCVLPYIRHLDAIKAIYQN